ncbi:haloacid dehalogenase-like hydrolase domain-containing protein [Ditylenchus destructor]|nr:haloacid dehalogenase-like hydrolase domain-containing protein [Ditylenchus destructor]
MRSQVSFLKEVTCLRTADSESLRRFVGQGGRVMIERAFAAQQKQVDDVKLDHLVEEFREHYAAHMPARMVYTLAVCTNKFEALAVKLLTSMGEANRFAAICGADTFAYRKPDPRHLTDTIAKAGGNRDRAIMVGDSRTDIDTAKAAGIPVVAVDFGYTDLLVQHYEPSRVISHYDEFTLNMAEQLLEAVADQV